MKLLALVAGLLGIWFAEGAHAQVVTARAGDHGHFTRLVFYFQPGRDWQAVDVEGGFRVSFDHADLVLAASDVYRKISGKRVATLQSDRTTGSVFLELACRCETTAYLHRPGMLVVDVADSVLIEELAETEFVQGVEPYSPQALTPPQAQSGAIAPAVPQTAPRVATGRVDPLPVIESETAPNLLPSGARPAPQSDPLSLIDPFAGRIQPDSARVRDTRNAVLEELTRAANQGLLQPRPQLETEGNTASQGHEGDLADFFNSLPNARAQTSIDRALSNSGSGHSLNADGAPCIPDQALQISNWAPADTAINQISEFRLKLFREFDEENRDAALGLAKTYVYLTFGAEAINVLDRFEVSGTDADLLKTLGVIVDQGYAPDPGLFSNQATCKGNSALWAVLAFEDFPRGLSIDTDAVLLAFSGLPLHLRRHLGPTLALRFLRFGDADAALAIRDAIDRAPGDHGMGFELLSANIDLELGKKSDAALQFEEIAAQSGALAPQALIQRIDMAIESERPLPEGAVDTVAALAFEYRGTDIGARLAKAYVLANIVENRFDEALSSLLRIETGEESESQVFPELWSQLALGMARAEDDVLFLSAYYKHRDTLADREISRQAREKLAARLTGLGFGREAVAELTTESQANSRPDPILAAQAYIAAGNLERARAYLVSQDSTEAAKLLAPLEERRNNYSQAAQIYSELADTQSQVDADWRAGNWTAVVRSAEGPRLAAAQLMTESDPYALSQANEALREIDSDAVIAENEARLLHSAWVRHTLERLLQD